MEREELIQFTFKLRKLGATIPLDIMEKAIAICSLTPAEQLCDGCNVREPFEHRCHGEGCNCDNPVCMERQGKITHDQLMDIVNKELANPAPRPSLTAEEFLVKRNYDPTLAYPHLLVVQLMEEYASL